MIPRAALALLLAAGLLGCGEFDAIAARDARAEQFGAERLRRDASAAAALCRDQASYSYLQLTLGLSESPPPFGKWYETEAARDGVPWREYCRQLDQTGVVFHEGVLVLDEYARALEALAGGKDFDAGGLEQIGSGLAGAAADLHLPDPVSVSAKALGSAGPDVAAFVVQRWRTKELRALLEDGAPAWRAVVQGLSKYLEALEDLRGATRRYRTRTLALAEKDRGAAGAYGSAAEGILAFDLGHGSQERLEGIRRRLATDRELLSLIATTHDALVAAAESKSEHEVNRWLGTLTRSIERLERRRPEVP